MRAALACTLVLLVGFASVSSAHAHVQPQGPPQVGAIAAAAATETCCHDVNGEALACAASACCPAAAGVALASSLTLNRKPSVVSLTYDSRAGSLASPPLLHPPISA